MIAQDWILDFVSIVFNAYLGPNQTLEMILM